MDLYSDLPIVSKENDLLNRSDFCNNIANYIISPSSNDGLVISINGKWGSGKTSIANIIKANIRERSFTKDSKVIPILVDYAPWNINDNNQIIKQFLNTLSDCFVYKKVLKIVARILRFTSITTSLAPVPSAIKETAKNIDKTFSEYVNALNNNSGSIEEYKNRVKTYLNKSILRYVVFIDDLDRLNNFEIKILIHLIKSTCNFSNITYVLLYDKNIVANALSEEQGGVDGYKYLEKIVQMEFNVPQIKHDILISILEKDLETLLGDKINTSFVNRLQDYISLGLFSQMVTIREEKRFMNNLRFMIDSFDGEIDIIDLIVITYLRTLDEKIYELILVYDDYLLGTSSYLTGDGETNRQKEEFYKKLSETKYRFKKHDYILRELFPHMFSKIPDKYGEDYFAGRICIPNIFHKYINMDFDYEDMPLAKINDIITTRDSERLSTFAHNLNPDQGRQLLHILDSFAADLNDIDAFKYILTFLFNEFSKLQYSHPLFIVNKNHYVGSICNSLVHNININDAERLLIETVDVGTDISAMVWLCKYLTYRDQDKLFDFKSVSEKTIITIKDTTSKKVLKAFKIDINAGYYDYTSVIDFILRNDENGIKKLINENDDGWKITLIVNSVYIGHSYSGHSHNHHYYYDLELLKKVFDFKNIDIDRLISKCKNDAYKQRLIVLKMQLAGVSLADKEIRGYSISDIQSYCDSNNIQFKASDDIETSLVD